MAAVSLTRLYGILDTGYSDPRQWPEMAQKLIEGGVGMLQIRAKGATTSEISAWTPEVLTTCRASGVPLILNDYPELARELNVDGCHLGQDDMSLDQARGILNESQICGKSTHSLQQAIDAEQEGADYIGFGPIFSTPTKPDYVPIGAEEIRQMYWQIQVPAFCIGGIKTTNISRLAAAGCQRIVIVSGLLTATDPRFYAETALSQLQ